MKKFTCSAPAKVNLFLEISQKRADGYHEAYSIMHTLALHDEIEVDIYDSEGEQQPIALPTIEIELHCAEGVETLDVALQDNSAYRAATLFFERFTDQIPDISHVHITITKYIPHQAGLGGGSSDAAAVLKVLCSYFNIDSLSDGVLKIAYTLGADVAFFLYGGAVALGNRGDAFERRLISTYQPIVLVKPQGGVSTAAAYNAFDSGSYEIDTHRAGCARAATEAQNVLLANNLAPASEVLLGELRDIRLWLENQVGIVMQDKKPAVLLSGSGSTTFALCDSKESASRIACDAQAHGWWACATFLSE